VVPGAVRIWARSTIRRNGVAPGRSKFWRTAATQPRTLSLFPEDRCAGAPAARLTVHVKLRSCSCAGRAMGRIWLALTLWRELQLGPVLGRRGLGMSRKGTRWDQVLFVLVASAAGAGQRMAAAPRVVSAQRAVRSAGGECRAAEIHKLYRCHDRLLAHKQAVF